MAENPKVLKLAANGNDVTFPLSTLVCGREPRHNAVRSNNLQDVQVFNNARRSGQNGLFVDPPSTHRSVRRPERNKVRVKVMIHVCTRVAADRRQGHRGLGFNQASAGMTELSAKRVTFGMEVKGDALPRSHRGHLANENKGSILIHLGTKFNYKGQPARIILGIDFALPARIAVERQNVLARTEHAARYR
jgi:hypothetical protein